MSDRIEPGPREDASQGVQAREMVVFYRSCGYFSPLGNCWHLQVRGSIFSANPSRIRRSVLLQLLKRVVKPENAAEVRQRFNDRARLFLHNGRKGKSVPIAIAEKSFQLPDTQPNGQFEATITFPAADLAPIIQTDTIGRRFVRFCARLSEDDARLFTGEIELISPAGYSVVSDVDDTIKVTNVQNRKELLANTFTREFRSISGMRDLYQSWAGQGISFHYVSASPWPLYGPLTGWLDADRFPAGTMHLRHVRLRDLRGNRTREAAFKAKRFSIENLLRIYPARQFLLIGDSGERDAELYGEISRLFGDQILHVAIRDCGHGDASLAVVKSRLSHLPPDRFTIFKEPSELAHIIPVEAVSQLPISV